MLNKLTLVFAIFLVGCTGEFEFELNEEQAELSTKIGGLFESSKVNASTMMGQMLVVNVIGTEAFELNLNQRDELASKIKDLCIANNSDPTQITVFFMTETDGLHSSVYGWEKKGSNYVLSDIDS